MTVLSKVLANTFKLDVLQANCYETVHLWNPDCYGALLDALPQAIKFCLKTYGLFYLVHRLSFISFLLKLETFRLAVSLKRVIHVNWIINDSSKTSFVHPYF